MMPDTKNSDRTTAIVNMNTRAFPPVCWTAACEGAGQSGGHESEAGPDAPEGSDCRFEAIDTANHGKATIIAAKSPN